MSLPSLLARKVKAIKQLVDYSKSYVVTSIEYLEMGIEKEVKEHIKEGEKMEREVRKETWITKLLNATKQTLTKQAKRQTKKYFDKT